MLLKIRFSFDNCHLYTWSVRFINAWTELKLIARQMHISVVAYYRSLAASGAPLLTT